MNNVSRLSSPALRGCQLTVLSRECGSCNEDSKGQTTFSRPTPEWYGDDNLVKMIGMTTA